MRPPATAKKRLLSLAAVFVLCALLISPAAEATRYVPNGLETLPAAPPLLPKDLDQTATEDFWLFAEIDVQCTAPMGIARMDPAVSSRDPDATSPEML